MRPFVQRLLSRKFLVALAAFVSVQVTPELEAKWQAIASAIIAAAYAIAEAYADGRSSTPPGA